MASYQSAWNSWQRSAEFYGFDVMCRTSSGEYLPLQDTLRLIDLYVGFECGLRQLQPATLQNSYFSGIAKVFDINKVLNQFRAATLHSVTKTLMDGYSRLWTQKHPAHQRAKIPFTMVLALQTETFLRSGDLVIHGLTSFGASSTATMETARITCALLFGIFFLLRKGEFLPHPDKPASAHRPMLRSSLRFMTADQQEIPYNLIGHLRASWLTITIEFSKADQTGRGRIVTHYVDVGNPEHCIVQRMEAYIVTSRDLFGARASDPLFHIPGFPAFTTHILTYAMRMTCKLIGLPWDRVSAHSLRYGGATTLAAAGFPEYVIAFYGGWAPGSRAMRTYIKPSNDIIRRVSHHMTRAQSSLAVQHAVNQLLVHRVPHNIAGSVPIPFSTTAFARILPPVRFLA